MTTEQIIKVAEENSFKLRDSINETCLLFRSISNQDIYLDINIDVDEDEDYTHEIHLYNGVTDKVFFSEFMSESDFDSIVEDVLKSNKGEF